MNNPETQTTLVTRHRTNTNKTKPTTQKTKTIINTEPPKTRGVHVKGKQFLKRCTN